MSEASRPLLIEPARWMALGVACVNQGAAARLASEVGRAGFGPEGWPALRLFRAVESGQGVEEALRSLGLPACQTMRPWDAMVSALAEYAALMRGLQLADRIDRASRSFKGSDFIAAARKLVEKAEGELGPAAADVARVRTG